MARDTEPKCKRCRREGVKLNLKGTRCDSAKCPFEGQRRRDYPPGMAAATAGPRRSKRSTYGRGLREKQKCKRVYGVLERPFKNYFATAARMKGNTGENLLVLLERRLDNVVRRLGLGLSRDHARQLVNHGHIYVDDRRVDVPSYRVRPGQRITCTTKEKVRQHCVETVEVNRRNQLPSWLSFDAESLTGTVESLPKPDEALHPLSMQLIVEFCSKG